MEHKVYLTTKKNPKGNGLIAIISQGQPQLGDKHVVILSLEIVPNMKAARKWFKQMLIEKPWKIRN